MTACAWACCTASQTRAEQPSALVDRRSRASAQYSVSGTPSTYSMANQGVPSGERVGVVEPRDRGMVELRQRALLAGEALAPRRGQPGVAQDLDRDAAAEVLALGEVDDAHPAFAEQPA